MTNQLKNKLTKVACKQLATGTKFKQPRMREIQESLDLYNGKVKPALRGRSNIPIPVMSGFIDTLRSEIDDPINITFKGQEDSDVRKARKVQAAFDFDTKDTKGDWNSHDLDQKTCAAFSGVGIAKVYCKKDPYEARNDTVLWTDFITEPKGGAYLKNHKFHGQTNIPRTKAELKNNKYYDQTQVKKLISRTNDSDFQKNDEITQGKADLASSLGLDEESYNYVGQPTFILTEWIMQWNGKLYYLFFDYTTGTWIRAELLKDIFSNNQSPFEAWQTHRFPSMFWTKAPADDVKPLCYSMHRLFNLAIDAKKKGIWGQRAYDPKVIPDPSQLEWRPDGLVEATTEEGQPISNGIFEFRSPSGEVSGTINLIEWIKGFGGRETGITPSSQGATEKDKKVGIYYGDLQMVANRMKLYNTSYKNFQSKIGSRYVSGLKDTITGKRMVRILGDSGWQDVELVKDDLDIEFDIVPSSSREEAEQDQLKRKSKAEALFIIEKSPRLNANIGSQWSTEQILRNAGYSEDEIKIAMDVQSEGSRDSIVMAAEENQKIRDGEVPPANRQATTAHLQRHIDFSDKVAMEMEEDISPKKKAELEELFFNIYQHIKTEIPFAQQNSFRMAQQNLAGMSRGRETTTPKPEPGTGEGVPEQEPSAQVQGYRQKSQNISNQLQP